MASVTSGLSAADSQNIIRATDALNKLTRSINSLDTTSKDLVKSAIRLNMLLKSLDNLDRGINKFQINLTKSGMNIEKQKAINTAIPQEQSKAAAAIRQLDFEPEQFKNKNVEKFYSTTSRRLNNTVDIGVAGTSLGGSSISAISAIAGVLYKNTLDDDDIAREEKSRALDKLINNVNQLQHYRDTDSLQLKNKSISVSEEFLKKLDSSRDNIIFGIDKRRDNIEKLKVDRVESYVDSGDGEIRYYNSPADPKAVSVMENEIGNLNKSLKDNLNVRATFENFINQVKSDIAKEFSVNPINLEGALNGKQLKESAAISSNNDVEIDTQTFSISFEQQKYNAINQTTEARERDIDAMVRAYELEREKESAVGVAKDIVSQSKNPYELIDEKEAQQFRDIESLNTYAQSTEDYRLYQEARVAIAAQASEARQSIRQNEEQMDRQATLNGLTDMNSAVTGLMGIAEAARGKQSGTYKALFAMSKAFSVAQATLHLQGAILSALDAPENVTVAQKFASMAAVASAGVQLLSSITSITMSGQAHAGIDYIPREGTWLLDRGERVVDSRTNADLKQYLSKSNGGSGGGSSVSVNVPLSIQSESSGGSGVTAEDASILAGMIKSKVYEIVSNEQRPGGLLSRG